MYNCIAKIRTDYPSSMFASSCILIIVFSSFILSLRLHPQIPLVPYATEAMLALQIASFLLVLPALRFSYNKINMFVIIVWILLFFWAMFSGVWSDFFIVSIRRALTVFVPTTMLLLLVYADPNPDHTFWRFAVGMTYFGLFLAFAGILIYFLGIPEGRIQTLDFGLWRVSQTVSGNFPFLRISSLTGNPNRLSLWLSYTLTTTAALYYSKRISTSRFFLFSLIQAGALLITFSRAGISAAIISLGLLTLFTKSINWQKVKRFAIPGALSIAIVLTLISVSASLQNLLFVRVTPLSGRERVWTYAWQSFLDQPFTGVGFGVSRESVLMPLGTTLNTHNAYLSIMVELGIIGAFFILAVCGVALLASLMKAFGIAPLSFAAAILISIIFHQLFESMILNVDYNLTIVFIYFAGLSTHPIFFRKSPG